MTRRGLRRLVLGTACAVLLPAGVVSSEPATSGPVSEPDPAQSVAETAHRDALDAVAAARQARAAEPQSPRAAAALAQALLRAGAPAAALDALADLRRLAPEREDGWLLAALVLRDVDQLDEAVALLREAIEAGVGDPLEPRVANQLGLLLLARGEAREALAVAEAADRSPAASDDLALVRGLALAALPERRAEAATWLERELERDLERLREASGRESSEQNPSGKNPSIGASGIGRLHLELGAIYVEDGCDPRALEHLQAAREALPRSAEALYRLGNGLARCGEREAAAEVLERSRALAADDDRRDHARRTLGARLNDVRRQAADGALDDALTALEALETELASDGDPRIDLLRARLLLSSGRTLAAFEAAARARSLAPARVEGHFLEGVALSRLGRADEAREALGRALLLDPDLGDAHALLAAHLADAGDAEGAEHHFREALRTGTEGASLRLGYAKVLDALGRHEDSRRQLEMARALGAPLPTSDANGGSAP